MVRITFALEQYNIASAQENIAFALENFTFALKNITFAILMLLLHYCTVCKKGGGTVW